MEFIAEPDFFPVDSRVNLRIIGRADGHLGPGSAISYILPPSWTAARYSQSFTKELQTDNPDGDNFVSVSSPGARFELSIERIRLPSGDLDRHRRRITARLGEGEVPPGGEVIFELRNTTSPWIAESGRVRIFVNGRESEDAPMLTTLPAEAERVKVIIPSGAEPGVPFPVRIISLDPFWNLSSSSFEDGVLRVESGPIVEDGISFKGSYRTEARIHREGIFRLCFNDISSNPIRIGRGVHGPYWGDLHSHDSIHNCGFGEDPYGYAREVSCLDFMALADDYRGLSRDVWELQRARANRADKPGLFAAFLAYEAGFKSGHYNVIFRDGDGEIFDVTDSSFLDIRRILPTLDPKRAMAIPHHMGISWGHISSYPPEGEGWIHLLEIYSHHGQSERYDPDHVLAYEFNRMHGREGRFNISVQVPSYAQDAWRRGFRFGTVAGSDDHMAQPGKDVRGLTAVFAPGCTRSDIFDALKKRRCYATTGERILLDFRINGRSMGEELTAGRGDWLDIEVEVHGTDDIASIEVLRCYLRGEEGWEVAFREVPLRRDVNYRFDDVFTRDVIYYVRLRQIHTVAGWPAYAWSSPIWVTW